MINRPPGSGQINAPRTATPPIGVVLFRPHTHTPYPAPPFCTLSYMLCSAEPIRTDLIHNILHKGGRGSVGRFSPILSGALCLEGLVGKIMMICISRVRPNLAGLIRFVAHCQVFFPIYLTTPAWCRSYSARHGQLGLFARVRTRIHSLPMPYPESFPSQPGNFFHLDPKIVAQKFGFWNFMLYVCRELLHHHIKSRRYEKINIRPD